MTPFATVADYEARYGEVADEDRLETALSDASLFVAAEMARAGVEVDPDDEAQAAALTYVTCLVVHRTQSADAYAGFSSVSQGADGYSASASIYNPGGGFRLYAEERRMLGIGGSRIGSVAPLVDGWYGSNAGDAK